MKQILNRLFVTGLLVVTQAWAEAPNYDTNSGIVSFPRVTVNDKDRYINVDLLLNPNGSWKILAYEPESELQLTGEWNGSASGTALKSFIPGMTCNTEFLEFILAQNGNEVTGIATFHNGCHAGQKGTIKGSITDTSLYFDLTLKDQTIMQFLGTISNDFCALGGQYNYDADDESGTWAMSCQK